MYGNICKLPVMAKAAKKKASKKPNKYDITVKTDLSLEELFKLAINTPAKSLKPPKGKK